MREKIKLESTAGTGHFYTTTKNKRTMPEKMEIKKYDPRARKHVVYKETKIKNNGVAAFSTMIVDKDAAEDGKVVGTCDGGTKKIVYKRGAAEAPAPAAPAPAAKKGPQ